MKQGVEDSWTSLKREFKIQSASMDELMELTGLQQVKLEAIKTVQKLLLDQQLKKQQRVVTTCMYCSFAFMGNPGTGKTIVARLFGKILHEIGMRKTANFVETTGQQLVLNGAIKADVTIQSAMDGVLFIDEAHSLDPKSNRAEGWAIITKLLKAASDQRDRITIILAG
jgi:replication-associated recombination protein RarA